MADKLEIEIGMLMEVVNDDNDVVFNARVIDYNGEAVTVEGTEIAAYSFTDAITLKGVIGNE